MSGENVVKIVVQSDDDTAAGFAASKASAEEAAGSVDEYAAATDRAAEAETDFRAAQAEAAQAQARLDELNQSGAASADELAAAQDRVTQATLASIDAQVRLGEADAGVAGASRAAGDAAEEQGVKADASGGLMAGAGGKIKLAALGVAVGMGLAVKSAMDFQQQSTKWVTSAGESASQLGMLQQGVLSLSAQTATSSEQLSDGLYTISSAGITGAGGLSVLKAAAEGAKSEGADLGEVTNALTSGINAYGMKTKTSAEATVSATSMMNQMLATVSAGKMTFQELASSLSSVLPIAAANKISYAQVGGALATMTSMGVSARQGTQDLAATIRSLGNPTSVATNEMAEFGISSTDVSSKLGSRGLTGTIAYLSDAITSKMGPSGLVLVNSMNQSKAAAADATTMLSQLPHSIQDVAKAYLNGSISQQTWTNDLKAMPPLTANLAREFGTVAGKAHSFNSLLTSGSPAAQTYAAAMAKMLGGATGLNVGLMLTGTHAATFNQNVKSIAASSDGASGKVSGFSDVTKETSFQLDKAGDSIKAAGTELGLTLLPAVNAILTPLSSMLGFIAGNKVAADAFAVVAGAVLAGALGGKLAGAFTSVKEGAQGFASGIEWVIGKLTAQTAATEAATAATEEQAAATEEADAAMDANPIGLIVAAIALLVIAIVELIKHWKDVEDAAKTVWKAVKDAVVDVFDWVKSHWPLLLAILTGPIGLAVLFIVDHWRQILTGAENMVHDVVSWFERLPGMILSAVGNLGSLLWKSGVSVISGLIGGITSMIGSLGSVMGGIASKIGGFIGLSPAKEGPLSGGGAPEVRGRHIAQDIAAGMMSGTSVVAAAAQKLAGAAAHGAAALGPGSSAAGYGYAGGPGGGAAGGRVTLQITGNDSSIVKALVLALRKEIRVQGGNVQQVLGH